jgi:uncharacterized protein GlcG (DUF336 family)
MTAITLSQAQTLVTGALKQARTKEFQPLAVIVMDARGVPKAFAAEDGTSLRRYEIAHGKAHGALAMGIGSRTLGKRAEERPHFFAAVSHVVGGAMVPVPGGVLIRDGGGEIVGSVGVSGDTSDNDEDAAIAGIKAASLTPDAG